MQNFKLGQTSYDEIIIGAGIGGLVCGCYLAKLGRKVAIIEKNDNPGGYCVSFKRKGFIFDGAAHVLTTFSPNGIMRKIFEELEISFEDNIIRIDPSDIIITPDHEIKFYNDVHKTVLSLQKHFPKDSEGIDNFFSLLSSSSYAAFYSKFRKKPFISILKKYFSERKLIETMSCFLGVMGIPASKASAFSALVLYQKYLLDGGYYPIGGMRHLIELLVKKFRKFGGCLFLSCEATKIINAKNKVKFVQFCDLKSNFKLDKISTKAIVSDVDARYTFMKLLDPNEVDKKYITKLKRIIPSPSAFVVYLGVKKSIRHSLKMCSGLWYTADYKINDFFAKTYEGLVDFQENKVLCTFPSLYTKEMAPKNGLVINLIVPAPFKGDDFWKSNKTAMEESLIRRAEKVIPHLSENIIVKDGASPSTFSNYTNNYRGAIRGWANTVNQSDIFLLPMSTPIENLFLVSHWSTFPGIGGIGSVAFSGRHLAKSITSK